MKKLIQVLLLLFIGMSLSSCLTTEYKEYSFKINKDGSGSGIIKYINILSQEDDGSNVTATDFGELIDNYLNGSAFEEENPFYKITNKRLFEEEGVLCGEIEFTFFYIDSIGFTQFADCDCSPLMYYLGSLSETLIDTDGNYLGLDRDFPIITWDAGTKEVFIKTMVESDLSTSHSLLSMYKAFSETE